MSKILPTIGPASESISDIKKMLNISSSVRINGSHNTLNWHKKVANTVKKLKKDSTILLDVPGIKPRTANKEEILINGFENAALEYSDSDSARIGGKLGWIREDALNKIIKKELSSLKVKSITNPIFTPNGYLVLKIEDIKFLEKEYDIEKELKKLVEFKTNQQLNQFSNFYYNKVKKDVTINEL